MIKASLRSSAQGIMPMTEREAQANGVYSKAAAYIIILRESALRLSKELTASGVTSLVAKPVPPEVKISDSLSSFSAMTSRMAP